MGEVSTIGLDIAKSVFQVHGVDGTGAVVMRKRVGRSKVLEFFGGLSPCLIGLEACPSAHYWSRELAALGHTVKLMPPSYVKAYLKRNKNDANDAAAICEAVTRPSMRFVAIKTQDQQTGLMLHRTRGLLVRQRTMLSNAIRGHMAELGIISAKGRNGTAELLQIIGDVADDRIPPVARFCLELLARQYLTLIAEVSSIDKRIRSCEESRRLEEIPGIGPIVAHVTAPDQCCSYVRKFLPRRRPHVTQSGHSRRGCNERHNSRSKNVIFFSYRRHRLGLDLALLCRASQLSLERDDRRSNWKARNLISRNGKQAAI
jgi:transposase